MSDGKRPRPAGQTSVSTKKRKVLPEHARSKGFVTRDQRLPESPPLGSSAALQGSNSGFMAGVRARFGNAVGMLFGTPARVLNASCTAVMNPPPTQMAVFAEDEPVAQAPQKRQWTRRKDRELHQVAKRELNLIVTGDGGTSSGDNDQVVPKGEATDSTEVARKKTCENGKSCKCADSLWTAGGVGPELMLRTAEELSERIFVLYGKAVDPQTSNIDYSALVHSRDFHQYLLAARKLRYFDPLLLNDVERKAFFLNVYNSLMIHAIAVMAKPRTMFERISLYNTASYDIGGRAYSLNMIEHGVLRGNRAGSGPFAQPPFSESDARRQCELPTVDPRIHFALNCGARSCPSVRFYEAKSLDKTLDAATRTYLQEIEVDVENRVVTLPKLLQWYKVDFTAGGDVCGVIRWTLPYLEAEKSESVKKLLKEKSEGLAFKVVYGGYDWTVNDSSL